MSLVSSWRVTSAAEGLTRRWEPTANRPYAQISLLMNATCNSRGSSFTQIWEYFHHGRRRCFFRCGSSQQGLAWASRPVFFGLTLFWLVGLVGVVVRDLRSRDAAVFSDPSQWRADELPLEFRFITRETTLHELERTIGPSRPVADTGAVRYDLGSGGALFIHLDPPATPDSKVRGIQLYRSEESVPVFG